MDFTELISFRKMITPTIIQILFWIGVGLCILSGLVMVGTGLFSSFGSGLMVFQGLLVLAFGPVAVRIYCELIIVAFRMYEAMLDIRQSLTGKGQAASPPAQLPGTDFLRGGCRLSGSISALLVHLIRSRAAHREIAAGFPRSGRSDDPKAFP